MGDREIDFKALFKARRTPEAIRADNPVAFDEREARVAVLVEGVNQLLAAKAEAKAEAEKSAALGAQQQQHEQQTAALQQKHKGELQERKEREENRQRDAEQLLRQRERDHDFAESFYASLASR